MQKRISQILIIAKEKHKKVPNLLPANLDNEIIYVTYLIVVSDFFISP